MMGIELALLFALIGFSTGYKILCLVPVGSKSHNNFYSAVIHAAAVRGHEITMVAPYLVSTPHPNIRSVLLDKMDSSSFMPNVFKEPGFSITFSVGNQAPAICNDALQQKQVQKLKEEKFDLVLLSVFYSDCFLTIPYHLKVPYIWLVTAGNYAPFADTVGNPYFASFAPDPVFTFKAPLSFSERLISSLTATALTLYVNNVVTGWMDSECRRRKLCPEEMHYLGQVRQEARLSIVNRIQTLESPNLPYMPNVVPVGGIHCRLPEALPQDLNEWVRGSSHNGFIYFSLGSVVKTEDLSDKHIASILKVFSSLPQRILWKWNKDDLPNKPPNVKIGKWFPQQDILGDPHLKLFITHGGLLSTMEATFHGVPILGMPVFGDQVGNMKEVENQGWGRMVEWPDLNEDIFRTLITDIIGNHSMRTTVRKYSHLMRDQPHSPDDEATFWMEYVIRHNGAPHLASPAARMSWITLYNIDVWITVSLFLVIFLMALLLITKKLINVLLSFRSKKKTE